MFLFKTGDVLKCACNDPMEPRVYLVYAIGHDKKERLVYIGKSGTFRQTGRFGEQLLYKRINNEHDKMPRQQYFENKIKEMALSHVKIEWFVTFDNLHQDLPGYFEGLLIQEFYKSCKRLPHWNKKYQIHCIVYIGSKT